MGEQADQQPGPAGGTPPGLASPAFLLISLGRTVRDDIEAGLRAQGLSLRHLSALGHLSRQPGLSYSELGRRSGVTAQSMQATLRQLEQLEAVVRHTLPGRGRTAQLQVTATGADLLHRGQRVIRDADQRLLAHVPADQQEAFTELLLHTFAATIRSDTQTS